MVRPADQDGANQEWICLPQALVQQAKETAQKKDISPTASLPLADVAELAMDAIDRTSGGDTEKAAVVRAMAEAFGHSVTDLWQQLSLHLLDVAQRAQTGGIDAAVEGLPGQPPVDPEAAEVAGTSKAEVDPRTKTDMTGDLIYEMVRSGAAHLKAGLRNKLPKGTLISIQTSRKRYEGTEPPVTKNELRDTKHPWLETTGVVELGPGFGGALPLGGWCRLEGRAEVRGLVSYRRFSPSGPNNAPLSLSVEAARKMEPGEELELLGAGQLSGRAAVGVTAGLDTPVARAGLGVDLEATGRYDGQFSVGVTALGDEKVEVKLTHLNKVSSNLGLSVDLGLMMEDGLRRIDLPAIGDGMFTTLVEKRADQHYYAIIERFQKLKFDAGVAAGAARERAQTYVLDLSTPEGQKAYQGLVRLNAGAAEKAAKIGGPVDKVSTNLRTAWTRGIRAGVRFGPQKRVLYEALRTRTTERRISHEQLFRSDSTRRDEVLIAAGKRSLTWEAVSIRKPQDDEMETYYRLHYEDRNHMTGPDAVEDFRCLVDSLAVPLVEDRSAEPLPQSRLAQFFSDDDDTETQVDIYFTPAGVQKLEQTNRDQAFLAYLKVASDFQDTQVSGFHRVFEQFDERTRDILEEFIEVGFKVGGRALRFVKVKELEREYAARSGGRDLVEDARVVEKAYLFAMRLQHLNGANDPKAMNRFFTEMGESRLFCYRRAVAAMAHLAGPEDTLVHCLYMKSVGSASVHIEGLDEGALQPPDAFLAE